VESEEIHQNPLIYHRWLFTADKIERDPALLSIPLENIERWMVSGNLGNLDPLRRWRAIIHEAQSSPEGLRKMLDLLRDDSEDARFLKSCSPLPGVLSRQELDQFRCAWVH
jgi:hypothetical protein